MTPGLHARLLALVALLATLVIGGAIVAVGHAHTTHGTVLTRLANRFFAIDEYKSQVRHALVESAWQGACEPAVIACLFAERPHGLQLFAKRLELFADFLSFRLVDRGLLLLHNAQILLDPGAYAREASREEVFEESSQFRVEFNGRDLRGDERVCDDRSGLRCEEVHA